MADEMTDAQRTARVASLLNEMLNVLPATSSILVLTPEEIRRREEHALQLGDQINMLIHRE